MLILFYFLEERKPELDYGAAGMKKREVRSLWAQCLVQFSWVTQSCPTLCDRKDCSVLGFPVHYQLPELAQTHVRQIGDAI